MKIFNRGTDAKAATQQVQAPAPPAPAAPAPATRPPAPAAAPIAPATAPGLAAAPDLGVILDANVKEMSERIARLASSLESSQQERGSFEAKLEQMEERMRKLSSLTEMISAQYNPFVGDAPTEREPMPAPDVGLASPVVAAPPPPPPAPAMTAAIEPPALAPAPDPFAPLAAPPLPPEPAFAPAPEPAPAMAPEPAAEEHDVHIYAVRPGFEGSMLLLGWADMLLKAAGTREALLEVVNYYHNIGWIGDPARDQLLAYADGIAAPTAAPPSDWRANVEVHEKSLLFVEKLRAVNSRRA